MASKVSGVIEQIQPGGSSSTKYAIASTAYGYCETAANEAAKTVDMTGFKLDEGVTVHIKFKNGNTATSPTLNIEGTGAKAIRQYGTNLVSATVPINGWDAGAVISLTYDGSYWIKETTGDHAHSTQSLLRPNQLNGVNDVTLQALFSSVRANRLAFLPASQIIIEKTTDGGTTWADAGVSDTAKTQLFSEQRPSIAIPKLNDVKNTNCGIRITFTAMKYNVPANTAETQKYNYWNSTYVTATERYCQLKELYFWVSSTNDGISIKVQRATGASPDNWSTIFENTNWAATGWSGNDYVKFAQNTFGGGTNQTSNYWNYRIIFFTRNNKGGTTLATSNTTSGQSIMEIRGYGDTWWTRPNNYMAEDHIYTFDVNQNVTFPNRLTAKEIYSTNPMLLSAGKVYSNITGTNVILPAKTGMLFSNGIAFAHPNLSTANDVGWMRVLGTSEADMEFEIATGDDGGTANGERIVVRQYNASNVVAQEAVLLEKTTGATTFPVSVTAPALYKDTSIVPDTGNTTGSVGNTTTPVYVENGIIKSLGYTIAKSVPSDAVFTDTNQYHTTGTWGGTNSLTYTATAVNGADALAFTLATATTGAYGATKLYDGVDSTSTTLAATANAVKTAYDKAAGIVAAADAMVFKGVRSGADPTTYTPAANCGDTYKVDTAGLINGQPVEIGDILICTADNTAAATSSNVDTIKTKWVIIQNNVDGAVFKSTNSFTSGNLVIADGNNGKVKTSNNINKKVSISTINSDTFTTSYGSTLEIRHSSDDNTIWPLAIKNAYNASTSTGGWGTGIKLALGAEAEAGKWSGIRTSAISSYGNACALDLYADETHVVRINKTALLPADTSITLGDSTDMWSITWTQAIRGDNIKLQTYNNSTLYTVAEIANQAILPGTATAFNGRNIGATDRKWTNIYATTFNGDLDGNATTASLLKPIADTTTASASTWSIPSGSYQVWGERFSDTRLKYTPEGGTENTVTDTGDWTMWLTSGGTSNIATLNMRIDGTYYGNFNGTLTGSASKLGTSNVGSSRQPIYLANGTATAANYTVAHFGSAGKSNMNDIGKLWPSTGMTNLTSTSNVDTPKNGNTYSSGWHLYWDTSYSDDPSKTNAWVAQIINKPGSSSWWVRSRGGGTITNGTEWASGWRHLVTSDQTSVGSTTQPVYINENGEVTTAQYMFPIYYNNLDLTSTAPNPGAYCVSAQTNPVTGITEYGSVISLPGIATGTKHYAAQLYISSASGQTSDAHAYIRRLTSSPSWSAWSTLLDDKNTTAPSSTPTLSWGATSTIFTLNGTEVKVTAMAKPTAADIGAATSGHTHTLSIAEDTGTSALTLAYNKKYKLTAGGKTYIFTMPASDNTWRPIGTGASDAMAGNTVVTNVSYTSASDDAEYPVLMKNSTSTTTTAAGTKFNTGVTMNPSTSTITASAFNGNASSATEIKRFNVTSNDNSNATGYFLVYTWTINAWSNHRMSFIVNSRHTGAGLIDISVGNNASTVSLDNVYAQIKYWGVTGSGDVISSDSWQIYISSDAKTAYLFAKYNDYNEATITPLTATKPEKSTWMTSIGSTYGTLKASTSINAADSATNVTGTVAIANGGTGATTAADARTNLGLGTAATYDIVGTDSSKNGYSTSKVLIPRILTDGVMEVGKYIDFHATAGNSKDYDVRITAATTGITITGTTTGTFSGSLTGNASTATTLQNERKIWGRTFNGSADVTGDLDWDSDTYRQRIHLTDDGTADTAVFTFQQSENAGTNYLDLFTIKDNGNVIIGKRMSTTTPSSAVSTNRIAITPYYHTSGPWYIASKDNTSYAYLTIKYGDTEHFEMKSDGRIFVTSTVGAGSSTELGILNVKSTATISSGNQSWGLNHLASGVAAGGNTCLITGVANSTNNAAVFGFHYAGSDNAENYAEISLFNNNGLLKVFKTGQVSITKNITSTSTSTGSLVVAGGAGIIGALYVGSTASIGGNTTIGSTTAGALGLAQTNGTGLGISLYGGPKAVGALEYGIMFAKTATFGKCGSVTSDWATYFTMNRQDARGWIFKSNGGAQNGNNNVTSIAGNGNIYTSGNMTIKEVTLQWNSTDNSLDFIFA